MTAKPVAVLISDIHFTPSTLELATAALNQAIAKASALKVPIILAGDTLDSKAIMRGECVNRLLEIMSIPGPRTILLVGNHDLLNEKGAAHTLNFLAPYCRIVSTPVYDEQLDAWLLPYFNDSSLLHNFLLTKCERGQTIICHQGVQTAKMGHYVQDKTSLHPAAFADFRVISGHYHAAQDITCGPAQSGHVGTFTYIGTPYTVSFTEANDPPKGFRVLYDDGTLESIPTNLRKHVIVEMNSTELNYQLGVDPSDLLWIKVKGPTSDLAKLKKSDVALIVGHSNFKLDKIYSDAPVLEEKAAEMTEAQVMDALIDAGSDPAAKKDALKSLWREITCA